MSVEYIKGNLLDFPNNSNVIAHCVSSLQVSMGAGVAKSIKEECPAALEAYQKAFDTGQCILGTFSVAEVAGGKRVVNLVTQERLGTDHRQVDYEALYTALNTLKRSLEYARDQGRIYRLAIPWLSCGLAGGSQKVVGAMIEDIFGPSPIVCTVVGYLKPPKATFPTDEDSGKTAADSSVEQQSDSSS